MMEVSLLLSHVALPRDGHLEAAINLMANIGQKYNSRLLYGPLYSEIYQSFFKKCDWSKIYMDAKEDIPMNTPEP